MPFGDLVGLVYKYTATHNPAPPQISFAQIGAVEKELSAIDKAIAAMA